MPEPGFEHAIPLSASQKSYLFQSLRPTPDIGQISVQAVLRGKICEKRLTQVWRQLVTRHQCLRSSIQWEGLSHPVQVIHQHAEWPWQETSTPLSSPPVGALQLKKLEVARYCLEIHCHHILLDGWSVPILLNELVLAYSGATLPPAPLYTDFRHWLEDQPPDPGYWRDKVWPNQVGLLRSTTPLRTASLPLPEIGVAREFAKESRLTLSTLFHAAWAISLACWKGCKDVAFGRSGSGRQTSFPGIESLLAPLSGVLPLALSLNPRLGVRPWLRGLHRQLVELSRHEHTSLVEIHEWCDLPAGRQLFDSILLVQDFAHELAATQELSIKEFSSGVSTLYPLNLIAQPEGQTWTLKLLYDPVAVEGTAAKGLLETTRDTLQGLTKAKKLGELLNATLEGASFVQASKATPTSREPSSGLESALVSIWSETFGRPVGVEDDFFELGGHSLLALLLLEKIQSRLDVTIGLHQLVTHPTVESLASSVTSGQKTPWRSLIPLTPEGGRRPLFCVHADGGHVMHFLPLARALPEEQPVYGVQALGLAPGSEPPQSFAEMAEAYAREIRELQPQGPYRLLSHCAGIAVAIELAHRLQQLGEEIELLALVDASRPPLSSEQLRRETGTPLRRLRNWLGLIWRWMKRLKAADFRGVLDEVTRLVRVRLAARGYAAQGSRGIEDTITALHRRWTFPHYDGAIVILRSQNIARISPWREEWRSFAKRGVIFKRLETEHEQILEHPGVLAEALTEFLE